MVVSAMISTVAKAVGIGSSVLYSVCFVETGLKNTNNYKDHSGPAIGVCQLHLPTARDQLPYIDMLALMQPQVNFFVAGLYLKKLHNKYNNISDSVAAYNKGSVVIIDNDYQNHLYVDKVMKMFYSLEMVN